MQPIPSTILEKSDLLKKKKLERMVFYVFKSSLQSSSIWQIIMNNPFIMNF